MRHKRFFEKSREALTFDDILLVPSKSEVLPKNVILETYLSRNIRLNIPVVSAAMDTVTESRLAIALAQQGGMGYVGCKNIGELRDYNSVVKITNAGLKESHPHGVAITSEAPNYSLPDNFSGE